MSLNVKHRLNKNSVIKLVNKYCRRWFIDGLGAMALGLFSSLIIGLIISQISKIPGFSILDEFADIVNAGSPVVGSAIGVAIAYGLKNMPLVIFSSAATGAFGYMAGGPAGAFAAAIAGAEIGAFVAGKTPVDIIVTPIVTILTGCAIGYLIGVPLNSFMTWLGASIMSATELAPLPMGIIVAVVMGMVLTLPLSSAALCIMMGISGLAAGAATVGCCANMIGFAVISFKENGWGGFIAQALGTSMLQVPNIMAHPQIWFPAIIASAVCGPLSTTLFHMLNTPAGAGMGTSGLVGQFGTWSAMSGEVPAPSLVAQIIIIQFLLPAIIALIVGFILKKKGIIKPEYLILSLQN